MTFEEWAESQSMADLKAAHRRVFGVEAKAKDRKKLAKKIGRRVNEDAEAAVLLGVPGIVRTTMDTGTKKIASKSKRNGGKSTSALLQTAIKDLDEGAAKTIVGRVGSHFLEEDRLRSEKRSELREIREEMKGYREDLRASVLSDGDADDSPATVRKIGGLWECIEGCERRLKAVAAEYKEEIDRERGAIKAILDEIRQPTLPGVS